MHAVLAEDGRWHGGRTVRRFPTKGLTGTTPADLAWLTGTWLGHNGPDQVEEHWSPVRGDTLMGMFRWVKGDRVFFYELVVIEQDGAFVSFRIKHFYPGLVGWEERERAHEWRLVHLEGREAAFIELDEPVLRWSVYRRETDDRLVSYFVSEDADPTGEGLFEYTRG
jgi:hypothetical protein